MKSRRRMFFIVLVFYAKYFFSKIPVLCDDLSTINIVSNKINRTFILRKCLGEIRLTVFKTLEDVSKKILINCHRPIYEAQKIYLLANNERMWRERKNIYTKIHGMKINIGVDANLKLKNYDEHEHLKIFATTEWL